MATNTYVALDKVTVSGSSTTTIAFNSIPQTYTDLILVSSSSGSANAVIQTQFNGDTATNYSFTYMYGDGTSAASGRASGVNYVRAGRTASASTSFVPNILQIQNYSNSTTYKTVIERENDSAASVLASVGLWRSTAAITSVLLTISGGNFTAGSTFSLYGIKSQEASAYATGGIVTSDATYYYHTFLASGTFTPKQSLTCDVLQVAGGGAGGISSAAGGGGGAGGVSYLATQSVSTAQTVTVGAGGTRGIGASGTYTYATQPTNGSNSQFGSLTAAVGGGQGQGFAISGNTNGGSGGGGYGGSGVGGSGTSGQGNAGGNGSTGAPYRGGGGGGAGAVGGNANAGLAVGGVGTSAYSSWGAATGTGQNVSSTYYYAGGGGGSENSSSGGAGGYGGGGAGAPGNKLPGTDGTANTGGGGGASANSEAVTTYGSNGGSGIVIIRYAK